MYPYVSAGGCQKGPAMPSQDTLSPLAAEILAVHKALEKASPSAPGHPQQTLPEWHANEVDGAYLELLDKGLLTMIPTTLYRTTT
jgi:hypothetical protein